jgi:hypothetical protein
MIERTGRRTVPQIYIGERHVGGFDDLAALDRAGELVPLLQAGGQALLYRGQWAAADTVELERALGPLKARIASLDAWELPAQRGIRHALWLQPSGTCPPSYPRPVGVPAKQPLGGDQLRPFRPSGV